MGNQPWWLYDETTKPTVNFRYLVYGVGSTTIFVGNKPHLNYCGKGTTAGVVCTEEWMREFDVWISVTDEETLIPPNTQYFWFPWWEPDPPQEIIVKSFVKVMDQIHERGDQAIYLHCTAGQRHSPSMLGFWLKHLGKEKIEPILGLSGGGSRQMIFADAIQSQGRKSTSSKRRRYYSG